jgi:N-acetylneuraminate synthase
MKKSIVAKKKLNSGHLLTMEDIEFRSPGNGIDPYRYNEILGKRIKKDIEYQDIILLENLEN